MKKKFLFILFFFVFFVTGCGKYNESDVVKDLDKKLNKLKSYQVEGKLEIVNNDDVYNYDVLVSYKKKDYYKVSLKNTANNHEQIILKNPDGVYVLTPSLNKSFKFQSDWPYSNSQIYLLESLRDDIKNDDTREFVNNKNSYEFVTKVNYPNNRKLTSQKIILDKDLKPKTVKVLNEEKIPQMTMTFTNIDYSPTFKSNFFDLDIAMESAKVEETIESTSKLEDTIYPLVTPTGTKLVSEEKVEKTDGERVIMTFDGEKPFLLVEETANVFDELTVIPTYGDIYRLMDTLGVMTDHSLTWTTAGIEYYLVSDVMGTDELVEIAQSINVLPTMK